MSLPKPKCPKHNGSDHVEKYDNLWFCSLCELVFFAKGTGGAQKTDDFPIHYYGLPEKQGKKKAKDKPARGLKSAGKGPGKAK